MLLPIQTFFPSTRLKVVDMSCILATVYAFPLMIQTSEHSSPLLHGYPFDDKTVLMDLLDIYSISDVERMFDKQEDTSE